MDSLIWLEFELVQDFMAVLVTCKIDEDRIKSEVAIQTFSPLQVYGKNFRRSWVSNSTVNSLIWPEIKIIRDFMAVLITCKFDEAPIKNGSSYRSDIFPIISHKSNWHYRHSKDNFMWARSCENVMCHMRTTKAQIRLLMCAVWSAPL